MAATLPQLKAFLRREMAIARQGDFDRLGIVFGLEPTGMKPVV